MIKTGKYCLFIVLSLCSGAATFAQNYTELNGPFGGEVYDIISSGTTLIASLPGQGLVRSTDGGSAWEESNTGITDFYIADLEKDQVSGKLYALAYSRLFSSSDDGLTWITEASSGFQNAFSVKKTASYFFVVERTGKVYRSPTGTSWSLVNTITGSVTDLKVNASGHLFISTRGYGVYRSIDNGVTFTQLDADEGLVNTDDISSLSTDGSQIYALASDGPYKSTDGGDTWLSIKNALPDDYYQGRISSIGGSVFIFTYSNAWLSTDGGSTWSSIDSPLSVYGNGYFGTVQSLLAKSATELYVSFYDLGLYKTTDGGATWSEKNNGLTGHNPSTPNSLLFVPANNRLLYATTYPYGFYLSIDDGSSWDFVKSPPNHKQITGFRIIGSTIYAYGAGINKSTDNAQTWTEVHNGQIASCNITLKALVNTDNNTFYSYSEFNCSAGQGYYLLTSTDAGVTWTSQAISNLPDKSSSRVAGFNFHTDGEGNLYLLLIDYSSGANESQLYRIDPSTHAASLISNTGSTADIADIDSYNGNLYLLTNDNNLLISTDGADTWSAKPTPYGYGTLRIINDNTFYILNSEGAILSTDGGDNWTNSGSFGHRRSANDVVLSPTNYSYVQVDYGALLKSNAPVIPPDAPTDLTVRGFSEDDVALSWTDNSVNEEYFIIERSVNDNLSYDSVGYAERPDGYVQNFVYAESSYLEAETLYYFRVRAKGAGGKSSYSNEVSVTTLKDCKATSDIPLNHSWTATTLNESGVGVKTDPGISIQQLGSNVGFYVISNLNIGSAISVHGDAPTYFVENCGSVFMYWGDDIQRNNGTWDAASKTLTIQWQTQNFYPAFQETTTFQLNAVDPPPAAPTNVSAYIKTANEIVVTWANAEFAQQYQLQRSTTSGSGFVDIGAPTNGQTLLQIDNNAFTTGTTYYYRVIAMGSGGSSAPSAEAIVNFQTPLFDAVSLTGFDESSQGVSWIDFDNDNDEDLLIAPFVTTSPIVVYENTGNGSLQLVSVPGISDAQAAQYRWISVGDVNNDNQLDFLANGIGLPGNIFINKGNKEFEKVSLVPADELNANWYGELEDFNNDGRLDATLSQREDGPYAFFTQNGAGEFEPYVLGQIAADATFSRGGSWADYDNDGDQDFLRSRYALGEGDFDQLYENNGDGTFTRVSSTAFEQDFALSPRTISWADFDNDLDLDVFIGQNFSTLNNMLYRNNGDGTFTRLTGSAPAQAKTFTTYGSAWGDVDNDGDLDLLVANSTQSELFLNDGSGGFTKYAGTEYLVAPDATRTNIAFALADFDNNGTLDIATGKNIPADNSFPSILLKNNLIPGPDSHWLKVRLKGTTSNAAGIGARIVINTPDGKHQMRAISSHTGYGSCNSLIAHFGLKNNTSVSTIQVYWPSGIVQNIGTQAADQMIAITEDGAGPVHSLLLPADAAADADVNTPLAITFDEPPTPMAAKKISIYLTSDLVTPVLVLDASEGALDGDTVTFSLPAGLAEATPYTVVVDAGAFTDQYGNPSAEISWSFTTRDATGPQIEQFTSPASLAKGASTTFSLVVTDNIGVNEVVLHYRQLSKKEFLTLSGTTNSGVANQYDFQIPATFFDESGMEYYFTASDLSLNQSRSPATGYHKTLLLYSEENTNIPTLGFGGKKEDWRIFSIPFDLDDKSISSLFDEVVGNTELQVKIDYAFLSYKDNIAWSEYPSFTTIQRGKGYFSNIVKPLTVRVGNDLQAPSNDRENLFSLDLKQGWNMIGNPYLSAISWSDVAQYNQLTGTAAEIKKYVSGNYAADNQALQPYEGAFVFAPADIPNVAIPFMGQTAQGGRQGSGRPGDDIDSDSWMFNLTLAQGSLTSRLGAIGMAPDASNGFDDYDDVTPPRLFDYLELNFVHPEFFYKKFSRDIVPAQPAFAWDFEVNSNLKGMAALSWDHDVLQSAVHDMFLLDVAASQLIDMKASGSHRFDPKISRQFTIYFGKNLKITPPAVRLGKAYPNPTDGYTQFGFSLPDAGGQQQHVVLSVLDVTGNTVATPLARTFEPGYHEVSWNAKALPSGFYTYMLTVQTEKGKVIQTGKIIVK